jgi:hypothetical protein
MNLLSQVIYLALQNIAKKWTMPMESQIIQA